MCEDIFTGERLLLKCPASGLHRSMDRPATVGKRGTGYAATRSYASRRSKANLLEQAVASHQRESLIGILGIYIHVHGFGTFAPDWAFLAPRRL